MKNYIELHANEVDNIFIFVGDFRFGNSFLKNNNKFESLFLDGFTHPDKSLISQKNDKIMFEHALKVLDYYVEKYKNKVKFVFWCLNYRETMNIKKNKYITRGKYQHPIWNYHFLRSKYSNNIIDVSVIRDHIEEYTLDGQGHPSMKGFSFLYHTFTLKGAVHARNKVNDTYMEIMNKLFS